MSKYALRFICCRFSFEGLRLNFFYHALAHREHKRLAKSPTMTTTITLGEFIAFYNGTLVLLLSQMCKEVIQWFMLEWKLDESELLHY